MNRSAEAGLEHGLRKVLGVQARFDAGSRALYATDASNYRQVPMGVVFPRSPDEVEATLAVCREFGAPVVCRGAGTSLAGQCCNEAVVIDFSRHMNRILEIDPEARMARVEPGVILDKLKAETSPFGLTFGPDPATHTHCTLGGMIGNNSCGVHSVTAGRTSDNVLELGVVTYDGLRLVAAKGSPPGSDSIPSRQDRLGELYRGMRDLAREHGDEIRRRYPKIPRRISGYNLDELLGENDFNIARALTGTESTCAVVLEAVVKLIDDPAARVLTMLAFPDIFSAADAVPEVLDFAPAGLEGIDDVLVGNMERKRALREGRAMLGDGGGWLLVEFGGETTQHAASKARRLMDVMRGRCRSELFDSTAAQGSIWELRESALGVSAFVPGRPDAWEGWEDSAVAPGRLGGYIRDLRSLLDIHGYSGALYGHFGEGCVHTRINFDLISESGIARFRRFLDEAADLVVSHGGSLSGEHGDGQARGELLEKMFGARIVDAFRTFKGIWDPEGGLNPGKVVDPSPITSDLRLGASYRPWEPETHFSFPSDEGKLSRAVLRCVGVGKCRREAGGTMCPSYMVTRDEMHSTRGRARLLFEMLEGDPVDGGWRDEAVRESLDLCLSCKGCKSDCPVNVDIATYRAEFLAHYYRRRLRPRTAYSLGLIRGWARLGSLAPAAANALAQASLVRRAAGIAAERPAPPLASRTFRRWFRGRRHSGGGSKVILWPDTFTNYFQPEAGMAAVDVLEAAGFQVEIPSRNLCCGRPLYDFGMLGTAKRHLRRIMTELQKGHSEEVPVIGLEPSCVAVFRDELTNLFPEEPLAAALSRRFVTLGEVLAGRGYEPPKLDGRALIHGHCHHKAVLDFGADLKLLADTGLDVDVPDAGCCGLAGAFGYESGEKYELSVRAGERVLAPAVRSAGRDSLIVADGFSCRSQIEHLTGRRALHTAEVLGRALALGTSE